MQLIALLRHFTRPHTGRATPTIAVLVFLPELHVVHTLGVLEHPFNESAFRVEDEEPVVIPTTGASLARYSGPGHHVCEVSKADSLGVKNILNLITDY